MDLKKLLLSLRGGRLGGQTPAAPEQDALERARAAAASELARYNALSRSGHERMEEYLKHIYGLDRLVEAMLVCDLPYPWGYYRAASLAFYVKKAKKLFGYWGFTGEEVPLGQLDKYDREDEQAYRPRAKELWEQYQAEKKTAQEISAQCKAEDEAEQAFWEHCGTLPKQVCSYLAYELARQDPPRGHNVPRSFKVMGTRGAFWMHSWANTEPTNGVAFGIDRTCFAGRDPLLFYAYDCDIPRDCPLEKAAESESGWVAKVYETIEGYSSGIRLEGLRGWAILFRLDEKNVRKQDILYDSPGAEEQPDYVFTWPGAGEFQCTLGEVVDGKLIPLYRDDFAMK